MMGHPLAARGMPSHEALLARHACGVRAKYVAGCRCRACCAANTAYARERNQAIRKGEHRKLVSADRARQHLAKLSRAGIGTRSASDASGVARSMLCEIVAGDRTQIRASTERAILAVGVDCRRGSSVVDAASTWRLVDKIRALGYSDAAIARALGVRCERLQIGRTRVLASTAEAVRELHRRLRDGTRLDARATGSVLAHQLQRAWRSAPI